MSNNKPRKYRSPVVERIMEEMDNDPWYIKLKRWYDLQKWVLICLTRKYWDKSYQYYIFKRKIMTSNKKKRGT